MPLMTGSSQALSPGHPTRTDFPASKYRPARLARRALVLAAGVLTCASLVTASPARASRPNWQAAGDIVDVEVLVDGRAAPLFGAPDHFDRLYFQAFRGRNYSLAIHNNSGARVGVLIAVDGLNVVSGEKSALSRTEPMYVLGPYERAEIRGWRTSLREVRKFVFVDEARSYAERSGQANGDMGWIRVLAFREIGERPAPLLREEQGWRDNRRDAPGAAPRGGSAGEEKSARPQTGSARPPEPSRGAQPMSRGDAERHQAGSVDAAPKTLAIDGYRSELDNANPGTGWGDRSHDVVARTWFDPERLPVDHIVLRYEYESGLRALGIEPRGYRDRLRERENGDFGFAQPPKW